MSSRKTFSAVQTPEVLTSESSSRGNSEREPFFSSSRRYLSSSESGQTEDLGEQPVASEVRVWFSKQTLLGSITHRTADVVNNNAGLMLVAASQAFFAMMNIAVKKLNGLDPPVPALELVAVRMAITYICCITYMCVMKIPDPFLGPKGIRLLLAFRGISGFFGLSGLYYSLQYLSVSDATVLTFLTPFTTAIAGALILKETFTRKQAFAGLLSLLGVVLIARPSFIFGVEQEPDNAVGAVSRYGSKVTPAQRLGAVGIGLLGVVGATGAYISLRSIGKRAHTFHAIASFSIQSVIASTIGMIVIKIPVVLPTRIEWFFLFVLIGIFGFIAQILLTMGLQRETAGRGTMANYVQIVFATILEFVFFHTTPPFLSALGTTVIVGSAVYVALTKGQDQSQVVVPPDHSGESTLEQGLLENAEEDSGDYDGDRLLPALETKAAERVQVDPTKPVEST